MPARRHQPHLPREASHNAGLSAVHPDKRREAVGISVYVLHLPQFGG
jgi:hypothetical protein